MQRFERFFPDRPLSSITADEILSFLNQITQDCRNSTKRLRYSTLKSFFSYVHEAIDPLLANPCENAMLKKAFRRSKFDPWAILDKDQIDEIIFRTIKPRNRLILELMARGGLRVSEVLKLRPADVHDRKLVIRSPKSGKPSEIAFIPIKVAGRLGDYIDKQQIGLTERIFQVSYTTARKVVQEAGNLVGIQLCPHDLRRHAATYASRAGTPLEIVSKIILRHANLSTTQRYLGKVSDTEAMRWIDHLHR